MLRLIFKVRVLLISLLNLFLLKLKANLFLILADVFEVCCQTRRIVYTQIADRTPTQAFIGGLYVEQGLEVVKKWIDSLFAPYAIASYNIARRDHGLPPLADPFRRPPVLCGTSSAALAMGAPAAHGAPSDFTNLPTVGHLALFNQHLQKANTKVEWIYSDGGAPPRGGGPGMDMGLMPAPGELLSSGTKATPVWHVKVVVDGNIYGRGRGDTKKAARNEAAKEGLKKLGIVVW